MGNRFVFEVKKNGETYRFIVRITMNGFKEYIGCFKTREDAVIARDKALKKNKMRVVS